MSDRDLVGLLGPDMPEVSCDTCFEQLDHYVELERDDANAEKVVPGMRAHLEGCGACREDHASLHAWLDLRQPLSSDGRTG